MNKEVTQFEYRLEHADPEKLNPLGKQGWEVSGYNNNGFALLKRPVGVINMELEETVVRKPNRDDGFSSNRNN